MRTRPPATLPCVRSPPPNALLQVPGGRFYGSAANGGDTTACAPDGCGTLFTIDRGTFALLHIFHATDGSGPTGLVRTPDGNLYGTTTSGGQPSGGGAGMLFRLTPAGGLTVLHAFVGGLGCCDGATPAAQLLLAGDGNLYGTTAAGGAYRDLDHRGGFGTVYRLVPARGALTILYGTTREGGQGAGTIFRIELYGTTQGGGGGTVFRSSPDGTVEIVNRFDGADGSRPSFGLLQGSDGFLYGTTPRAGCCPSSTASCSGWTRTARSSSCTRSPGRTASCPTRV